MTAGDALVHLAVVEGGRSVWAVLPAPVDRWYEAIVQGLGVGA